MTRLPLLFAILSLAFLLSSCAAARSLGFASPPATPTPNYNYQFHVVKPGETLSQIATRYRATVEQVIALNLEEYPALARDPSLIEPGWAVRVPRFSENANPTSTVQPQADFFQTAQEIVERTNTARAQRGLPLLRANVTLTRIAGDRSRDLIVRNYFSHYDPATGQEPLLRYLQASKFDYQYAGENIAEIKNDANWVPGILTVAARYGTSELAKKFADDWLNSPEHRENIFHTRYRRIGVGLAVSEDGRRITATQVFAD